MHYILLVFYLYFLCNIVTLCECHGKIKGYLLTYLLYTKKLWSRLFSTEVEIYWKNQQNCVLCHPVGDLRLTSTVLLWLSWKARGRLPVSANWTFFAGSHGWGAMSGYWSKFCCLKGRWVTLSANFRGKWVVHQRLLASEILRVPGLSRGVVCVILRLAVLIQYRRVRNRQTHTHTHTQTRDDG